MKRFVVVSTMRRGVLDKPEPLDPDGQLAAFNRALADAEQEARFPKRGSYGTKLQERIKR
jgi:hypothetical protein